MTRPEGTKSALLLAHEPSGTGELVTTRLRQRGFHVHEHIVTHDEERPNDAEPFPDVREYDVLVMMGSIRSLTNTDEIDSWIFEELEMVRDAHNRGVPTLGVCFGGQVLAEVLGGRVELSPVSEIGWYEITPLNGSNGGVDHPVGPGPWFQWHHDRFIPPEGAEILAVNDNAVQLFRVGSSVGTQFHPEVTVAHIEAFLRDASPEYLSEHNVDPAELLAETARQQENNTRQCEALVDWFLDTTQT